MKLYTWYIWKEKDFIIFPTKIEDGWCAGYRLTFLENSTERSILCTYNAKDEFYKEINIKKVPDFFVHDIMKQVFEMHEMLLNDLYSVFLKDIK